jgi:PAS domain-containing protein
MDYAEQKTVPTGLPNTEILNTLHEGVYLVDLDCRIQFWNDAAAAIRHRQSTLL